MKVLSFDTETNISKGIHGPTFRDPNNDVYTQIWATHPDWVGVVHAPKGFKRTLYDKVKEELYYADYLVGHNIGFDLCYFWDQIVPFILRGGKIWDCQEVEYTLTGQQHSTASLAELQEKHLGQKEKPSRISYLYKKGIGADRITQASRRCPRLFRLYEDYCRTDGTTPLRIFKKQYILAKQQGMLPLIEMRNEYLLVQLLMSCTGININVQRCEELLKEYNIKHLECLKEARDILSSVWNDNRLPEFKVNSPDHKSAVLFGGKIKADKKEKIHIGYFKNGNPKYESRDLFIEIKGFGLPVSLSIPAAKKGFYATNEKVLKTIKLSKNIPQKVLRYCELQEQAMRYKKAANTYCEAFLNRCVDGVLYPHFNNTITPTGRLSSSEPNMQNIPSKGEFADDLMGLLIPPEGYTCVSCDFSQLEKWVQAWVSGDKSLTQELLKGTCLHCLMLSNIENIDYQYVYQKAKVEEDPVWNNKRTNIKPIGFRMDYGGMAEGTAQDLEIDLEFVQKVHDADRQLFPAKYVFFEEELPNIVKRGCTYSLSCNIPQSKKKGKDGAQIFGKAEMLPIFDKSGKIFYNKRELRRIGYWQTSYGKKYHFTDKGRFQKNGQIKRWFPMPKFKNYPNQGGAADIQGATSAELLPILLKKQDTIKILLEIHDSKLFYVKTSKLQEVISWLKTVIEDIPKIFNKRFGVDVPFKFPIEFKIGNNFSPKQMTKYEI